MKLHYFRDRAYANLGDQLNEWIWERLLGTPFDGRDDAVLVGIGTLLNDRVPPAPRVLVFGSGMGYGGGPPRVDGRWTFYCVRGPLSARSLGLPDNAAVTDPAVLVSSFHRLASGPRQYRFSFMPHSLFSHHADAEWRSVCEDIGFGYIDGRWPIEKFIEALSRADVLISESLHGAIIADAMRVPWIPVASALTFPYKWIDWTRSMALGYQPGQVPILWPWAGLRTRLAYRLLSPHWVRVREAKRALLRISSSMAPLLSSDGTRQARLDQLNERLGRFKEEWCR